MNKRFLLIYLAVMLVIVLTLVLAKDLKDIWLIILVGLGFLITSIFTYSSRKK